MTHYIHSADILTAIAKGIVFVPVIFNIISQSLSIAYH